MTTELLRARIIGIKFDLLQRMDNLRGDGPKDVYANGAWRGMSIAVGQIDRLLQESEVSTDDS